MSLWGRISAALYDPLMRSTEQAGLADKRRQLLARAHGRVLEIGGGTGANLPYYGAAVEEVVLVEPEEPMARRLERKLDESSVRGRVIRAPAEELPFADDSFDCAVSTLVLCTVEDQLRALAEIRRVLKPAGRLLFIEHVRSDEPGLARWQDRLVRPWSVLARGCHPNRRTLERIEAAGFQVDTLERGELPKSPALVRPLIAGTASRR